MSDFYKMDPAAWDFGTACLSLEEEAAYLRIVNAIHKHRGPVPDNDRVLAGLFRTSTRKARALVQRLCEAGKVSISDGFISNERAISDLVHRGFVSISRAEMGAKGGRTRAENAAKALESNEPAQAIASSREEKRREEKNPPNPPRGLFADFWQVWPSKEGKAAAEKAWKKLSPEDRATALARVGPWFAAWRAKHPDASPIHASTFLNQRRWEDEGAPAIPVGDKYAVAASTIKTGKPFLCKNISAAFARELIGRGFVSDSECRKAGVI